MVIFQYNLYIFSVRLWTVLYTKLCYNDLCYKEVVVYFLFYYSSFLWHRRDIRSIQVFLFYYIHVYSEYWIPRRYVFVEKSEKYRYFFIEKKLSDHELWSPHMGCAMWKLVIGYMWTVKAQIRLRFRAVWSGPSLSTNRIIGYYRMYDWRVKTRMILCACIGSVQISAFCACL